MATQVEKLNRTANTPGILGVTFRPRDVVGIDDVAFFPSPSHPAPPMLGSMLAETMRTLDTCGRAGVLVKDGVRVKLDHEGYSVLVMDGPDGTVSIAFLTGHPVVKSVNRPARSIVGHRRDYAATPRRHPSGTEGPREPAP
jgi:hypothetical protein